MVCENGVSIHHQDKKKDLMTADNLMQELNIKEKAIESKKNYVFVHYNNIYKKREVTST